MVYVCVVGKMAQDVGMVRSTCTVVSFLPCFAAFRQFHPYMHLFSYQNLWHLFLLFCFCFKGRREEGGGRRGRRREERKEERKEEGGEGGGGRRGRTRRRRREEVQRKYVWLRSLYCS